jgi:hypothetical protein
MFGQETIDAKSEIHLYKVCDKLSQTNIDNYKKLVVNKLPNFNLAFQLLNNLKNT